MDLGSGLMHYGIFLEVYSVTTFVSLYTSEMAYIGGARMVANIEAFVGGLVMAFFLVLTVRKLFR